MHWTPRRERYRALLEGDRCVHPASVFDAMSARMAEDLGFEMGMFSGSVGSLSVLGVPDIVLLTLSEFAAQAYRINRAGNLPLAVDADHGYGNALNVRRTVEELETAGVVALSIEDTDLPRPYGTSKNRLIPIEEGMDKIRAALDARQDPNLVIAARTTVGITPFEEVVERAKAYATTGVDALFFAGMKTREQLEQVSDAVDLPIGLGSTPPVLSGDLDYLSSKNVKSALQGHLPIHAAMKAAYDTLKALREGTPPGEIENVAGGDLKDMMIRGKDYKAWLKDFLASG
ncbi:MAG: isocitrate lyase/PEP mutase family protein [Rhodospirillales bacterium]|jgi:carboxyvinyl-carboxyphosphonate phosphorylmutase